jgi:hypothetical protein
MSHFAKIDQNNMVTQVIVAEQEVINTGLFGDPASWIQTSYNTHGGVHRLGGTPLRKNYAGIGYSYNSTNDCFVPPKPFASWTLNINTCLWQPPVAMPTDNKMYQWNETAQVWDEITVTVPAQE